MKVKFLLLLLLSIACFGTVGVSADHYDSLPLEKGFFEIGYKPAEEALNLCEDHFQQKIELPYKVPPISFTHYLGRCTNNLGSSNGFEVEYLNEKRPELHYMIHIKPKEHGLKVDKEHVAKTFKLNDGKGVYVTELIRSFNLFIFERDGWQYILSIDKRGSRQVPPEVLTDIANSFK
ncbi:hypothetical protein J7E71_13505 [Mesobacillus foraminis]|uniref:hypothetical protein n=1 Tax=Mesobacillus foraminis TaxID=279826 RepID=UPI001BE782FE|nr:hypothetical protein [Mesobacillus foraminis]MBT2756960.1 hypothetical protein [Mesobacillus foraminis]